MQAATKIKLKVCGMRDHDNITAVSLYAPDYMGFIFYSKSPRFVGQDFRLPENFPDNITPVGVFVNEELEVMIKAASQLHTRVLQLHGNESVEMCAQLKDSGYTVVKVFSVDEAMDFSTVKPYEQVVDYFLFDTKGKYYGGNAKTFSWEILNRYDQQVPFFLSGGLSPENIEGISMLKGMNLYAIDINSGAEVSPGVKDVAKIKLIQERVYTV